MLVLRMMRVALRLVGPYGWAPWRSPLLRWRMETYGIFDERGHLLHADEITPARFRRFVVTHYRILWAFLRWAARLSVSDRSHRVAWS